MTDPVRIVLFTGDGKGKTTAALGMAIRAAGHGLRTCLVQFIKSRASGEHEALQGLPGIQIVRTGLGFLPPADDPAFARHKQAAETGLHQAAEAMGSGRFDLVILDEICLAVAEGLLEEDRVLELLRQGSPNQVIVLTGRGATQKLIELADTVTEMRCLKHALSSGRQAQKGVEL
ncbi:MAG: cob(I)yrinic acid a,c-diamide adenosyltransferase [Thermoguttaceae bacterium]